MQKQKSQIINFILTFLFGPFGLFYSNIPIALLLIFFTIATLILVDKYPLFLISQPLSILIGMWTIYKNNKKYQVNMNSIAIQEKNQDVSVYSNNVFRDPTGQIVEINNQRLGIIDLGTDLSSEIRNYINKNILTHGEPFKSGGVLSSSCLLGLAGTGSAAASSLFAGNIFFSTAAPGTLTTITSGGITGFGTLIKGAGGKIISHAPFIQASGAIIPVVVPVMFFMTLCSIMMSVRFDKIQISLDQLGPVNTIREHDFLCFVVYERCNLKQISETWNSPRPNLNGSHRCFPNSAVT